MLAAKMLAYHRVIQLCLPDEVIERGCRWKIQLWLVAQIGEPIYDEISHKPFVFKTTALYPANERRLTY